MNKQDEGSEGNRGSIISRVKGKAKALADFGTTGVDQGLDSVAGKMADVIKELAKRFNKHELPGSTRVSVSSNLMAFSVTLEVDLDAMNDIRTPVESMNTDSDAAE